jgi:hypothetical protein
MPQNAMQLLKLLINLSSFSEVLLSRAPDESFTNPTINLIRIASFRTLAQKGRLLFAVFGANSMQHNTTSEERILISA